MAHEIAQYARKLKLGMVIDAAICISPRTSPACAWYQALTRKLPREVSSPIRLTTSIKAAFLLMAGGLSLRPPNKKRRTRFRIRNLCGSGRGGPWIRITDGKHWDDKPHSSPDGKVIYFLSGRSGFFNVWGVRFDPDNGKTIGDPLPITVFDSPSEMIPKYMPAVSLSLTQDSLVPTVAQVSGNIWVLDNLKPGIGRDAYEAASGNFKLARYLGNSANRS